MKTVKPRTSSLRTRLFVVLVVPLVLVALMSSFVRYWSARDMSNDLYDDTLKVVAHAIAREVVLTKGDLVAEALLDSLVGALGDPIFYQVRGADGHFVTGRSDAPIPSLSLDVPRGTPVFFDSNYLGRPVRAVILREFISDTHFDGWTTVQVWQTVTQRQALSLSLVGQSVLNLLLMVGSAAILFWFGIKRGLIPLTELRTALAQRSANDLRPIRRQVPHEVEPLVETINSLFSRLREELDRRNAFIGNAAHQLRNPVAAIQAQAEAALGAGNEHDRATRLTDLVQAARQLSRMSHQLLNFDIANESTDNHLQPPVDLTQLVAEVARRHVPRALKAHVDIGLEPARELLPVAGNKVLLEEAIDNLVDNALKYGCPEGGKLSLVVRRDGDLAVLTVTDQGPGIPAEARDRVFERFIRLTEDSDGGCGLGLPIVRAIAKRSGGDVGIVPSENGCSVCLRLPIALAGTFDEEPPHMQAAAE